MHGWDSEPTNWNADCDGDIFKKEILDDFCDGIKEVVVSRVRVISNKNNNLNIVP